MTPSTPVKLPNRQCRDHAALVLLPRSRRPSARPAAARRYTKRECSRPDIQSARNAHHRQQHRDSPPLGIFFQFHKRRLAANGVQITGITAIYQRRRQSLIHRLPDAVEQLDQGSVKAAILIHGLTFTTLKVDNRLRNENFLT